MLPSSRSTAQPRSGPRRARRTMATGVVSVRGVRAGSGPASAASTTAGWSTRGSRGRAPEQYAGIVPPTCGEHRHRPVPGDLLDDQHLGAVEHAELDGDLRRACAGPAGTAAPPRAARAGSGRGRRSRTAGCRCGSGRRACPASPGAASGRRCGGSSSAAARTGRRARPGSARGGSGRRRRGSRRPGRGRRGRRRPSRWAGTHRWFRAVIPVRLAQ